MVTFFPPYRGWGFLLKPPDGASINKLSPQHAQLLALLGFCALYAAPQYAKINTKVPSPEYVENKARHNHAGLATSAAAAQRWLESRLAGTKWTP